MSHDDLETAEAVIRGLRKAKCLMKNIMTGFEPVMDVEGLNTTHYRTLVILHDFGDMIMKDICQKLAIEAGSFTPVADKLIEEGLALRITDERDRRRTLLSLTGEGRDFTGQIKEMIGRHMNQRLATLCEEDKCRFLDALQVLGDVDRLLEENLHE